jgi:chromosome segregation ATPase
MKKIISTLAVTMFIGSALNVVMAQKTEVKTTSNQQGDSKELQEFRKETNEKIKENEKTIADFKDKMSKEKQEVREKYDKKIEQAEKKNKELKKRLAEYKEENSKSNWTSFKAEFNHDMDELGKSLKDLTVNNVK